MVAIDPQVTEVEVLPVPETSAVALTLSNGDYNWHLFDLLGRTLAQGHEGTGAARVNVPEGLSLLEISHAGDVRVFRVAGVHQGTFVERVR